MVKECMQLDKCRLCKYAEPIQATSNFRFVGCYHHPYKGKWIAEIKECPKKQKSEIGHWIYDSYYGGYYICSECGHAQALKSSECPQCHTKMEVKNENE
jgi:ribosomal protein L40E